MVPNEITTWAVITIERTHRLLKHLFDTDYQRFNAAELMAQCTEIVSARIIKGRYDN